MSASSPPPNPLAQLAAGRLGRSERDAAAEKARRNPYAHRLFLVIDSVPEMQRALAMTLASFGADKVEYASRASDALAKLSKYDFDVVLCDYDLGNGYDGLYLFEEVKERNLIKQSCVFMIVTGERRAPRVISAAELVPDDYLLKPFTGEVLRLRLERAMRRREAFKVVDDAVQRHDYLGAIDICNRMLAERNEFMIDFMKLKGSLALKIEDFHTAGQLYQEVLKIKEVGWAKLGLAKSLTGLKSYDEARQLFEEVLVENGRVMEAYDWLARLHQNNHQLEEAQAVLKTATGLSPVVIRRQQALAAVALRNGDLDVAEAACQTTLELAKYTWHRHPTLYADLAHVQLSRGEPSQASRTLSNLRRDFRYNEVGEWMADVVDSQIQTKTGQPQKAQQLLAAAKERYQKLAGELPAEAQMEFARACYAQKDLEAGDAVMRELVRNHHDDEALLSRIGALFEESSRGEAGRELISASVQTVIDLNNAAVKEAQAGRLDEALERFAKAHEEMPANVQVTLNLVNATLALVQRQGWHESHMRRAHELMLKVRKDAPANAKFQKLQQAWRLAIDKLGMPQWTL
ncbi:response regulator [Crenobacter cavernae]|uniref:Response regulator n=1 Tax=Crenobacter cavernae TaxID=2290923 RepID=A0A345Y448_9NEIS|nr:response regulator [Crenobacter cavernae]AXK38700.1 response regulator [Crenobacter cavernae]